jgi:protein-tyrosine sulfotransferase
MSIPCADDPIFILGILPRSGTNFLFNLLRLHPDCGVTDPIWEDYVLEPSPLLMEYAQAVYNWWDAADPPWAVDESYQARLCQHLGRGLISFLSSGSDKKRLLTKTPCVSNLDNFFKLFPNGYLLILVRDGRDLVESAVRSFGWDRDKTTRRWAAAAQTIQHFTEANRGQDLRCMIVRYEDLYADLDAELRRVLDFVNLDTASYDFSEAYDLPVYGSSEVTKTEDSVHWRPMDRVESDFNPIARWSGWNRRMHERFNWLAGHSLRALGYEEKTYEGRERSWRTYNRIVDQVQKYKPYEYLPRSVWKLIKGLGYRMLGMQPDRMRSSWK